MGIWGWSYGGYASGLALAKDDSGIFKCAASVAPVTDWIYYGKLLGLSVFFIFIISIFLSR